jgi:hypothetical protein
MPGRVTFKKGAKVGRIETNLDNPQAALGTNARPLTSSASSPTFT